MLIDILTAMAFIGPEIGYCQDMNFIGEALINLIMKKNVFRFFYLLLLI